MRGIFISYRREDAEGQAGRLFDDLCAHFGHDAVFMDVAGIRKGVDFRRIIQEHVTSCGVLLVIVGRGWLSATDSAGKRRLEDPNDFVRLETAAALSRDIPVVPVLVHGATMPREQDLPAVLRDLAFRNGAELTHARWDSDVKALIDDLKPYLGSSVRVVPAGQSSIDETQTPARAEPPRRRSSVLVIGAALGIAAIAGSAWMHSKPIVQTNRGVQDSSAPAIARPPDVATQPVRDNPTIASAPTAPVMPIAPVVPKPADDPVKIAQATAEADAAKAAAARAAAARAAAARRDAEEQRRRDDAVRAARAEEQQRRDEAERTARAEERRKHDEETRRLAQEQAEKERAAAEQAAAAKVFTEFAAAVIGSRAANRR
ncbi:MAG TPA: TIR domain-containing protein [Burkholderiaceae bacterium]|nr:TIR domain-containing protein [Burkholderiaceae bacterium]